MASATSTSSSSSADVSKTKSPSNSDKVAVTSSNSSSNSSSSTSSTAQSTSQSTSTEPVDVQRVIAQYKAMRAQITELANKLSEVDSDRQEHQLVIRAIENLDPTRKCYRSIGGVLVERTVGEVLPAVEKNMAGISDLIAKLTSDLQTLEKQTDEFRIQYNISMGEGEQQQEA